MLSEFKGLYELGLPPVFLLSQLEDMLQKIFLRSLIAAKVLQETPEPISMVDFAHVLGVSECDIPLILAITGTHAPGLTGQLLAEA